MPIKIGDSLDLGNAAQLLNALLQVLASDPSGPAEGRIWYDSSAKAIKFYDGTDVITLGEAGAGGDATTLDGLDSTYFLARANHSGTQVLATITGHDKAAHDALGIDAATLNGDVAADIIAGLATTGDVAAAIAALVDSAPGTLDTLNEIAAALGDDPDLVGTLTDLIAAKPTKFAVLVGDAAATQFTVTHNLNTEDVQVTVRYAAGTKEMIIPGWRTTGVNTVRIDIAPAPATDEFRVVVIG